MPRYGRGVGFFSEPTLTRGATSAQQLPDSLLGRSLFAQPDPHFHSATITSPQTNIPVRRYNAIVTLRLVWLLALLELELNRSENIGRKSCNPTVGFCPFCLFDSALLCINVLRSIPNTNSECIVPTTGLQPKTG